MISIVPSAYYCPCGRRVVLARFEQVALKVLHSCLVGREQRCARVLAKAQVLKQGIRLGTRLVRCLGDFKHRSLLLLDEERALR